MISDSRFDRGSTAALALLLAFMFWLVRNDTERPMAQSVLRPEGGYVVAFTGEPAGWAAYVSGPEQISVTARGLSERLDDLQPDRLEPIIDVSNVDPVAGSHRLPVEWRWRGRRVRGISIVDITPSELVVRFDAWITDTRRVAVRASGLTERGIVLESERVTPADLIVEGPARRVAQIAEAVAILPGVDQEPGVSHRYANVSVMLLDRSGTPVPEVTSVPASVDVVARFNPRGVRLPVMVPPPVGSVPDGYWLRGRQVDPPEVVLYGPPEQIADLLAAGVVNAVVIDVTGFTSTRQVRVPLALPAGLGAEGLPDEMITVTILVEALPGRREYERDVVADDLPPGLTATFSPSSVLVALNGPQPVLEGLSGTSITARVVLTNLTPGSYRLPVVVALPDGLDLAVDDIAPDLVEVTLVGTPLPVSGPTGPTPVRRVATPTP